MTSEELDEPISINCTVQELAYGMVCSNFLMSFDMACAAADLNGDWDSMKSLTLEQAMGELAQGGIRFMHSEHFEIEEHLESAQDIAAAIEFLKKN